MFPAVLGTLTTLAQARAQFRVTEYVVWSWSGLPSGWRRQAAHPLPTHKLLEGTLRGNVRGGREWKVRGVVIWSERYMKNSSSSAVQILTVFTASDRASNLNCNVHVLGRDLFFQLATDSQGLPRQILHFLLSVFSVSFRTSLNLYPKGMVMFEFYLLNKFIECGLLKNSVSRGNKGSQLRHKINRAFLRN